MGYLPLYKYFNCLPTPFGNTDVTLCMYNNLLYFFRTKEKVLCNRQVGHMLRTKLADANEGGVAAGLGALDSPYLLDL